MTAPSILMRTKISVNSLSLSLSKIEIVCLRLFISSFKVRFNSCKSTIFCSKRYFICSDDRITEERFDALPNVVRYIKTEYAGKLVEGGWLDQTTDTNGRVYNYNVNRPRQSVIEAFIDLLILSRTTIEFTVKSSFSRLAVVYSHINL